MKCDSSDGETDGIRLDLHVHTCYSSDSKSRVIDVLKTIDKKGLHGLAITDHNEIDGSLKARRLGKDANLIVVRGIEISSTKGHILAYGINDVIPNGMTPAETIEEITDAGGIAVAAHPYRRISGIGERTARQYGFIAIETLNGRSTSRENARAMKLANSLNRTSTGGSDAHELGHLGNAYTLFPLDVSTEDDVINALAKGKIRTGGNSNTVDEIFKYYLSITTKWAKRGFRKV